MDCVAFGPVLRCLLASDRVQNNITRMLGRGGQLIIAKGYCTLAGWAKGAVLVARHRTSGVSRPLS